MKKILYSLSLIFCLGLTLSSCFGDLDTMPLDESQLVTEKVYSTPEGYTGVLAKCYASLILTGQQGGDGGDGDLEGAVTWKEPMKDIPDIPVCYSICRNSIQIIS